MFLLKGEVCLAARLEAINQLAGGVSERVAVMDRDRRALVHGPLLLHQRGIPIADPSGWPMVLAVKLGLVAILLLSTLTHDLILGPRVGWIVQLPTESRTRFDHTLVLWSPWVARLSLFLALAVLFAAVMLVRSSEPGSSGLSG